MKKTCNKLVHLGTILLLGLHFVLVAGCKKGPDATQKRGGMPAPVSVKEVRITTMPRDLRAVGTVEPAASVVLKPRVEGQISEIHFREGQEVKKGDLLFTIDLKPYEVALNQVLAVLEREKAQASNAQLQLSRYASLKDENIVSSEQIDQIRSAAESSAAAVKAAEAAVERARLELSYCRITSPVDGQAGDVKADIGNLVEANKTELVTINTTAPAFVMFSIAEQNLGEIRERMAEESLPVTVLIPGVSKKSAQGLLVFVDNQVNRTTGTVLLKGKFDNEDRSLWPGQFVDVVLNIANEANVTVVPTESIQVGQKGAHVFVVKSDMSIEQRQVQVKRRVAENTIVTSGVEAGEKVVTDGLLRLTPGMKVEIKSGQEPGKQNSAPEKAAAQERASREPDRS